MLKADDNTLTQDTHEKEVIRDLLMIPGIGEYGGKKICFVVSLNLFLYVL